jgi:hypothetical protein
MNLTDAQISAIRKWAATLVSVQAKGTSRLDSDVDRQTETPRCPLGERHDLPDLPLQRPAGFVRIGAAIKPM